MILKQILNKKLLKNTETQNQPEYYNNITIRKKQNIKIQNLLKDNQ